MRNDFVTWIVTSLEVEVTRTSCVSRTGCGQGLDPDVIVYGEKLLVVRWEITGMVIVTGKLAVGILWGGFGSRKCQSDEKSLTGSLIFASGGL